MKAKILLFVLCGLLLSACEKPADEGPTYIQISDSGGDGVYVIAPQPNLFGNVVLTVIPASDNGQAIVTLENRLDKPVGYRIRSVSDPSFVYFFDSYIGGKDVSTKTGTKIPLNEPVEITMIAYKSTFSYAIVAIIENLGLDYWQSFGDYKNQLEVVYQNQVIFQP
jgi:hypothetical protein